MFSSPEHDYKLLAFLWCGVVWLFKKDSASKPATS